MNIYHYKIVKDNLVLNQVLKTQINVKGLKIITSEIMGEKDAEQEKIFILIYIIFDENEKTMKINCR